MNNYPINIKTILELKNVKKHFYPGKIKVTALNGINLKFEENKFYSITGPSGSGKSSLMHIIGALDKPTEGDMFYQNKNINKMNDKSLTRLRANEIGFIFQNFNLNPILNAVENVAIALRINRISKEKALLKAKEVLNKVGLNDRYFHYPNELSGGEQQRVAVARAIVKNPTIILADEPTGNLDSKTGIGIIKLLEKIIEEQNTTVIQVTHNLELAKYSNYVIKLKDGKLIE